MCYNTFEEKLFTVAYTKAFFGFLRVSEIVGQGTGCRAGRAGLLCSYVNLVQKLSSEIRGSKIDQGNLGTVIQLGRIPENKVCPVQAVSVYMQERPKLQRDENVWYILTAAHCQGINFLPY